MTDKNIYLMFYVDSLFNFDTVVLSIFGQVTCLASFKRAGYSDNFGVSLLFFISFCYVQDHLDTNTYVLYAHFH